MIIQRTPVPILIQSCYHQFSDLSILGQSLSIKCRSCANPSANIPSPQKHIFANHFQSWTIHANPGQSYANPGYSEDKCASNLLNKLLYGLLVGLLGEWIGPIGHHNLHKLNKSRQMALSNDLKLALDWQGLGIPMPMLCQSTQRIGCGLV